MIPDRSIIMLQKNNLYAVVCGAKTPSVKSRSQQGSTHRKILYSLILT